MGVSGIGESRFPFILRDRLPPARVIEEEPTWRQRPAITDTGPQPRRIIPTRWRSFQQHALEVRAATAGNCHMVGIALRRINIRLSFCGHVVQDGMLMPGMLVANEPGLAVDGLLRGPTDVLHLHIPNGIIAECGEHAGLGGTAALPTSVSTARDPAIERLGMALLDSDQIGHPLGHIYADSISLAIVTRLLDAARKTAAGGRPKNSGLAKWRLKRVLDFIDGNLAESISLADLAAASGLTRMHFAAQFRAATGVRPHEYLLRRRIEHAQEMLRGSNEPIVDVALQVGFQTQAHFTSTFRKFVGQPPRAWCREQDPSIGASGTEPRSAACDRAARERRAVA